MCGLMENIPPNYFHIPNVLSLNSHLMLKCFQGVHAGKELTL